MQKKPKEIFKELQIENQNLIKKLPSVNHQIFKKFLKDDKSFCIGDKAFIYLLTEDRGRFNVITPKIPTKLDDYKNKILNTSNANFTRQVTSIRNVVESIMILLKGTFEKLSERIPLQLIPHLEQDLYNFAFLLNEYKDKGVTCRTPLQTTAKTHLTLLFCKKNHYEKIH